MKKQIRNFGIALAIIASAVALAVAPPAPTPNPLGSVTFSWTASASDTNAGDPYNYMVAWGTASGVYNNTTNVGTNLVATISGLTPGTYYFVGLCEDTNTSLVSAYTAQVAWTASPQPSPISALTLHVNAP